MTSEMCGLSWWEYMTFKGCGTLCITKVPIGMWNNYPCPCGALSCQEFPHRSLLMWSLVIQSLLDDPDYPYKSMGRYLTLSVGTPWNSLPNEVVQAPSLNSFKARLDKHWEAYQYLTDVKGILHKTNSKSRIDLTTYLWNLNWDIILWTFSSHLISYWLTAYLYCSSIIIQCWALSSKLTA